jgi:hypothetical protein
MTLRRSCWIVFVLMSFAIPGLAQEEKSGPKQAESKDRAVLEKGLAEKLTGAALVGTYSIDGRDERPPSPERYEIATAAKVNDNVWLVSARIKYGEIDVAIPVRVKVFWADDTPVISLTSATVPGLGTFTVRVMIYGDRYAGTWQHGEVGGHMWGRIEKAEKGKDETKEKKERVRKPGPPQGRVGSTNAHGTSP